MREVEYKAKMIDGGVWVYGHYCELAGRKYIVPDYSQFRDIHDAIERYNECVLDRNELGLWCL